ncbi:hypothetical protein AN948_01100 [Rhodococcus sp. ADH]|uniref:hypothetical protein n=1 Tax=unclassified Rhodococcus (in: high G+C Gram-positive bacteria) TaxID=192944 RepID=UPI0006BA0F75|nr:MULTISPECIES: hypothetical protein [unclassified Rhodococcus (in: high G+C Gram-positive bacteria)]KPH21559.1 hypothetical protein AN948_01100 [Rhodococcus sp. ADH]RGP44401.1 hypothetical protein AWH04_28570 [Rhodococcus erythropolis]
MANCNGYANNKREIDRREMDADAKAGVGTTTANSRFWVLSASYSGNGRDQTTRAATEAVDFDVASARASQTIELRWFI